MLLYLSLALVVGFVALVWSADRFVDGAVAAARYLGMSPLMIGITIVSIGTSAPEILVSLMAVSNGNPGIAIGNALGSNIANIGLVLGVTTLVVPVSINPQFLRLQVLLLIAATLLAGVLMWNLQLAWHDSVILIGMLIVSLFLLFRESHRRHTEETKEQTTVAIMGKGSAFFGLSVGLFVLIVSSKILVWGAAGIATLLGVSDLIVGLTIVAIGTSLPELAASITSALKGHADLALGNVLGSNLFNLCMVLAVPGLVTTIAIEPVALHRDYIVTLALTLLLALSCTACFKGKIRRWQGAVFFTIYSAYLMLLW